VVATGAGFTTTSSLLSWLIYGFVSYPGMQERLLQELIDNDIDDNTEITADITDRLDFLDKHIKETQRRHNPSFQPGRTAKVDLVLPGGYKIPKDAVVIPTPLSQQSQAVGQSQPFQPRQMEYGGGEKSPQSSICAICCRSANVYWIQLRAARGQGFSSEIDLSIQIQP
jgi:hypothetical protein